MIKKAVLLTLLAPFLMVFSDFALAYTWKYTGSSPKTRDQAVRHIANNYSNIVTKIRQDSPQAGGRFAIFRLAPGKTIEDIPQSDFLNEQISGYANRLEIKVKQVFYIDKYLKNIIFLPKNNNFFLKNFFFENVFFSMKKKSWMFFISIASQ